MIMKNKKQSSVQQFWDKITLKLSAEQVDEFLPLFEEVKTMYKEEQEQLSAGWAKLREQTRETAMHIGFARGFEDGLMCYEDYYQELDKTDLDEDDFTRNYIVDRFEEVYIKDNKTEQTNN
jgi:hypothetical protein